MTEESPIVEIEEAVGSYALVRCENGHRYYVDAGDAFAMLIGKPPPAAATRLKHDGAEEKP